MRGGHLLAALALVDRAVALSWPMSATSRVRSTGRAGSTAMYRLHRAPAATVGPRSSPEDSCPTRLAAVQTTSLDARASPQRFSRGILGKVRRLAVHAVADLVELHSWRRMASTVFVAVLVVAWREGLRRGMATNPFQIALMGVCVLLELIHLAEPDSNQPAP